MPAGVGHGRGDCAELAERVVPLQQRERDDDRDHAGHDGRSAGPVR